MPSEAKTGCNKRTKIGYVAVGYSREEDFWYSSEGVFRTRQLALDDLAGNPGWPVDFVYAIGVPLDMLPEPVGDNQ